MPLTRKTTKSPTRNRYISCLSAWGI